MERIIREAALADCSAITRLNREEMGYDYPQEKTFVKLQACLANPAHRIFVAEWGERWWATFTWKSMMCFMPATW